MSRAGVIPKPAGPQSVWFDPGLQVFNLYAYGAEGDGRHSDATALRAAVAAARAAGGGIVYAPAGTYNLDDGVSGAAISWDRDNDRSGGIVTIRGAGHGGTVFRLSAGTPRFLDFNRVANYDVFRGLSIEDLTIDANSITGKHHVILGTYRNNAFQTGINIEDIAIRRVKTTNVPADATGASARWNIGISVVPVAHGDSTRINIKNILVEDCIFSGGDEGVMVCGNHVSAADGVNILIGGVVIQRNWHSTLAAPTASGAQGNYFVGSYGMVQDVVIRDNYGYGAADLGIEVDNADHALIENNTIEEFYNCAYLAANFTTPLHGVNAQRFTFRGNVSRKMSASASTIDAAYYASSNNSVGLGHIEIIDPHHYTEKISTQSGGQLVSLVSRIAIQRVTIANANHVCNATYSAVGAVNLGVVLIDGTGTQVEIKGLKSRSTIVDANGAGAVTYLGLRLNGSACWYAVDDFQPRVDYTISGGQTPTAIMVSIADVGSDAPHTIGGVITRLRPLSVTGPTAGLRGVRWMNIAGWTPTPGFTLRDCDFSAMNGVTGWLDTVYSTGTENSGSVWYMPGNVWSLLTTAQGGYVATFTKAGAISDADFAIVPPIGTIGIDTTNFKIYIKVAAATWKVAPAAFV